ncbi:MAG: hypothetical protein RR416_05445 [Clostridia bacterium]
MIEYEIVLSKFISQQELFKMLQNISDCNVEIGGNGDQLYLQNTNTGETVAIIWTIEIDANGEPDNQKEVLKEYNYYNLSTPFNPFYSYLIECGDTNIIKIICKILIAFDNSALLLDDKMKKFKKIK